MPKTQDFRRALDIEQEMQSLIDQMDEARDSATLARLNARLDVLTRELARLQATVLATAA